MAATTILGFFGPKQYDTFKEASLGILLWEMVWLSEVDNYQNY